MNQFYKIPFKCQEIIEKKKQPVCTLYDSIGQHINLMFRTHFKENRFDANFGCMVWEKDFDTIRSVHKWKNELAESFQEPVKTYEKRLSQIQVTTDLDELKIVDSKTQKVIELRKRITIRVQGVITKTNESFYHTEFIFFSPLSMI